MGINISGCHDGWLFGVGNTGKYPDRTMSEKEWKKYLERIDAVQEVIRQQIQEEGKQNLERADKARGENRAFWQEEWEEAQADVKRGRTGFLQPDMADYNFFVQEELVHELESYSPEDGMVPYSQYMEDGVILYNGVVFTCNPVEHSICLGDMSDYRQVVTIPLAGGGLLKVNRNEIGSLARAMGMFCAEDVGNILRVLSEDRQVRANQHAIEEEENRTMEDMVS
ncbi:hypothetical protein D7V86_07240 [bacterium D16-51]|nr:hypothetical protein D7V96_10385 [bacterium D16-59]RKI60872.1 hypothetical protein D7V86_07240 [bacterium D16-51]